MVLLNAIDYVGIFLVLVIFLWRFNLAPAMPSPAAEGAGPGAKILKWFWASKGVASDLFLPPRANTTLFKYRLYQLIYAMLGLLIYLAILKIPALGHELQDIVKLIIPPEQLAIPDNVGPVVLAFLIAVVLPMIPPFSLWDAAIRFMLYERAAIPAQQLRERNRLKNRLIWPRPKTSTAFGKTCSRKALRRPTSITTQKIPAPVHCGPRRPC